MGEAIIHCEEVAEEQDMKAGFDTDNQTYIMSEMERKRCRECAAEHRQLAEWLRELKAYKNKYHKYYKPRRAKDASEGSN